MKDETKTKTIYNLELHETLEVKHLGSKMEITRVAGGWVYSFDYPGYRTAPLVFVPFDNEFMIIPKKTK